MNRWQVANAVSKTNCSYMWFCIAECVLFSRNVDTSIYLPLYYKAYVLLCFFNIYFKLCHFDIATFLQNFCFSHISTCRFTLRKGRNRVLPVILQWDVHRHWFSCFCFRCITICYIAPIEDVFFRLNRLRSAAGQLLQLIVDHKLQVSLLMSITN